MTFVFVGASNERMGMIRRYIGTLPCRAILLAAAATPLPAVGQPAASARPQGGQVVAGAAQISRTDALTRIDQSSQRAAIDWRSFNVGSGQQVDFQQPSASAVTLNRVTGSDPSQIAGKITANGQVVLVNQSGVLFTKGAQVNAQSVIVSAAGITDQNFMAGRMVFDQPARPDAKIVNNGRITVGQTGLAALVAPQVKNAGVISARLGHVILGGAETQTLDLYGDGLLSFDVTGQVRQAPVDKDGKTPTALVTNTGTIQADGGTVLLTASAMDGVIQNLVTAGGRISASTVGDKTGGDKTGTIVLEGTGGSLAVTGTLATRGRAPGTPGGQIQVASTGDVTLAGSARVDASGRAGGGTVAIGTTLARAKGGPSVKPSVLARSATIEAGATVSADATERGRGGNVTVLSANVTQHSGTITARGAPNGGDGGAVEISGQTLRLTGTSDAGARSADGAPGTLLLDPDDITIVANNPYNPYCPVVPPGDLGSKLPNIGFDPQPPTPGTVLVGTVTASEINAFGSASNVTISAKNSLTVNGINDAGGPVAIAIAAHSLTLLSGGTVALHNGASILAPSITINGGAVGSGLDQPLGGVFVNGALSANDVSLTGGGGGVSVAGSITGFNSALLTGGTIAPHNGPSISAQSLTIGAVGNSLNQTPPGVSINGALSAKNVVLTGSGGVAVAGSIAGLESVVLSGGTVAVRSGASISAPNITINGGVPGPGQPLGSVSINGTLSANDVALTGGGGGVSVVGSINGLNNVAHANLSVSSTSSGPVAFGSPIAIGTLALNVTGSVTQQQPIAVGLLTGSAASVRLDTPGNNIAQVGSLQVQDSLRIAQSPALTVAGGSVTAGGNIFLSADGGIQIGNGLSAGQLVATNGSPVELVSSGPIVERDGAITASTLNAVAPNVQLDGVNAIGSLAAGPVRGDQGVNDVATGTFALTNAQSLTIAKEIGGVSGVTLNIAGNLTLGTPQSRGVLVAQGPININVAGDVAAPNGLIATSDASLSGSSRSLSLTGLPQLFGTLGNYSAPNGIAITTAGDLVLNGNIATQSLHLDTNGTITRAGGSLSVGSLSGSALRLVDFGTNAQISTLGAFSVAGGEFALSTSVPLTIAGPLSAEFIRIRAPAQVTLSGTIATRGVPLALQSGAQPADPGSYIDVLPGRASAGNPVGRFVETGNAAIVPLGASTATLRIGVPGAGGRIAFSTLSAPRVFLVLDTGIGGRSSGTINVDGLLVLGTGGDARLFGTVGGVGGFDASVEVRIEPRIDPAYTINGCVIGASCLSAQNLPQVYSVESQARGSSPLSPLLLVAVPQFPVPFGWMSSPDVVPPNIAGPDY